ncbi:asparagine synthase (glutamine-hydrolyzing) [Candidatus Babeliales bacterium]|nr:asparagine synthase (glutamine-hydrolyzing) [Candidatus Babeliales bacterium]
MCGVTGIINWQEKKTFDLQKASVAMTHSLAHRGNDGEGFFSSSLMQCFFGHRRLSILDQSSAAQQPMSTSDNRYTLSYNGEIYNYKELKQKLVSLGITFASSSDTEILLYGYAVWGKNIFKQLRGMFAGCIWDEQKKEMVIFRDQIGIKPLYWWKDDHNFASASELQALRKHPLVPTIIDDNAVNEYFITGSIHAPNTIFKNIYALKPGHFITVTNQSIIEEQFWNINEIQTEDTVDSPEEIQDNVLNLLRDSIKHHVISDIPVGAFLSGGLDSSCIVALMKEQTEKQFDTFSIGFDTVGKNIDESKEAASIAHFFGTKHHHILTTSKTFAENFDRFIEYLDQPSSDGFNSFLVSQESAKNVHVALSGLGGDELFLGYRYHQELARFLPLKKHRFYPALSLLSSSINKSTVLKKILYRSPWQGLEKLTDSDNYQGYFDARNLSFPRTLFSSNKKISSWHSEYATQLLNDAFRTESDKLNAYSKAELLWYTPGTLLRDADVTGMAFTLEVRFPFLDMPLINYMLSLPSRYKVQPNKPPKALLRSILETLMPKKLLLPTKKGFEMPIGHWLIQHSEIYESLKDSALFNTNAIKKQIKTLENRPDNYLTIWQAVVFTKWLEKNNITYG